MNSVSTNTKETGNAYAPSEDRWNAVIRRDRNADAKFYYDVLDPASQRPWPPTPEIVRRLAERAAVQAGFMSFQPDSCLINRYEPGARLLLHQDRNERDFGQPIVSLSLGLPAIFLFGGQLRNERPPRMRRESGDVVVWGGASRLAFHGVAPLADGHHPLTGHCRINLTLRKAL